MKVPILIALCLCLVLSEVMCQYGSYTGQASGGYVNPYYRAPGGYVGPGNQVYDRYDRYGDRYGSGYRRDIDRKRRLKSGSRRGGYDRTRDYRRRYY